MAELKKYSFLLSLLLLLVMLKFVIVPVFLWQDEQLATIQLYKTKLRKMENVLSHQQEYQQANKALENSLNKVSKLFFSQKNQSTFKLKQQKLLESLLSENQLQYQNIGWKTISQVDGLNVESYQVEINFKGSSVNVVDFMLAIEHESKLIEIVDFNLKIRAQKENNLGTMNGRVTLALFNQIANTVKSNNGDV